MYYYNLSSNEVIKLVEKICNFILSKMRKKMPDITDEKAEVILYGLQLIIGEIPKMFLLVGVSFLLGIGWYTLFAFFALLPYRAMSGGFHLKTHLGCIIATNIFYLGNVTLSCLLDLENLQKYILIGLSLVFGLLMVSMYAPADTENVPIISKKERKIKKILSYVMLVVTLGVSLIIQNHVLSNILIIGTIEQSISISRLAYILTKNKYGHEEYLKQVQNNA